MRDKPWRVGARGRSVWADIRKWLHDKAIRRMTCLFILASMQLVVSLRMSDQQISYVIAYIEAKIGLFFGFDPVGKITINFFEGPLDVSRVLVPDFYFIVNAWMQFLNAAARGFGLAVLFIFVSLGWFIGRRIINEQEQKRADIEARMVLGKDIVRVQALSEKLQADKPSTVPEKHPDTGTAAAKPKQLPAPKSIPEIEAKIEKDCVPGYLPAVTELAPNVVSLRLPGRIYRSDDD